MNEFKTVPFLSHKPQPQ